jgi:polyisoprenoid-binding protein YceI
VRSASSPTELVRRAFRLLIVAVVVAVLAVGAFIGWYIFGSSAPGKPKLSATANTTGGPRTPDGSWRVVKGENVFVGYRIKELFGDAVLKRDAVGHSAAVGGTLTVAGNRVTAAVVTADLTQLGSDRSARDAYVRDNTLETAKFPNARFTLTKPIALTGTVTKGKSLKGLRATGRMLIHGVTRPITFLLDARWNGATIDVVGSAPIVLRDFDVTPPHTVIASVDDHGSVELDLTFAPSG